MNGFGFNQTQIQQPNIPDPVIWNGYFLDNHQQVPIEFQNLVFEVDGSICGAGLNSHGYYSITGKAFENGTFIFQLNSAGPIKQFEGKILGPGKIGGQFMSGNLDPVPFFLETNVKSWTGVFTDQKDGAQKMLNLTFGASKTLYGVGLEDLGVYIIHGKLDPSTYDIQLSKSYLGPNGFVVNYSGKMVNNGLFWVISGNYQLKIGMKVQRGTFEVFREAPEDQRDINPQSQQKPIAIFGINQQAPPVPAYLQNLQHGYSQPQGFPGTTPPNFNPNTSHKGYLNKTKTLVSYEKFSGSKASVDSLIDYMDKHDLAICGDGIDHMVRNIQDEDLLSSFLAQVSVYTQGLKFADLQKIVNQIRQPKGKAIAVKYLYSCLTQLPSHQEDELLYSNIPFEQYQDQIKKVIAQVKGY